MKIRRFDCANASFKMQLYQVRRNPSGIVENKFLPIAFVCRIGEFVVFCGFASRCVLGMGRGGDVFSIQLHSTSFFDSNQPPVYKTIWIRAMCFSRDQLDTSQEVA
jgi:hypothetical protein